MANFKCPKTGKEFNIHNYIMMNEASGTVYKDKITRKQLVNPDNGEILLHVKKDRSEEVNTFNYSCLNPDCELTETVNRNKMQKDRDVEELCPICEESMKCMGERCHTVIRGDIQTRILRNQKHFTKRAKKHAASDEQQVLKKKRQDQEFKSMGVHKKK